MALWVRRCLAFACLMAAWLVAHPARAAAPVCDASGASAIAPVPVLDTQAATLDAGTDCDDDALGDKAYHRGVRPHKAPPFCHGDAIVPDVPSLAARSLLAVTVPADVSGAARSGVLVGLERPPR